MGLLNEQGVFGAHPSTPAVLRKAKNKHNIATDLSNRIHIWGQAIQDRS
jgi:hypothetical protein